MSFMIAVPDGHSGSLYHCHVPLRSHMVARDVSRCYIIYQLHQPNVQEKLSVVFRSQSLQMIPVNIAAVYTGILPST